MLTGNSLETVRRSIVLDPNVNSMSELRRSTILFSQGQQAGTLYYVESGLVKLTRVNNSGGRLILSIRGAGDLLGEEALGGDGVVLNSEAEVISTASIYGVSREGVRRLIATDNSVALPLMEYLIEHRNELAEKVELLCLHDVEYRVLHYLQRLCKVAPKGLDSSGFQIPITQLELADLIGATRETTSTVLNQLERRGLVQLSRRMLTVKSPENLSDALEGVQEVPPTQPSGAERASQLT